MQHNDKLNRAKNAKNDEFYTRYADIEAEVNAYVEHDPHVFENKTILCPCDDPDRSNFTKYFINNFERFGLRKLISTCCQQNEHGKLVVMTRDGKFTGCLEGDGDFRSAEVTALRDEADIIITNPPFSLFREFLAWIMAGKKQFVIIGNINAITYKEVFPLLKANEIWLGAPFPKHGGWFDTPTGLKHLQNCRWFTNLPYERQCEKLHLHTMAWNLKHNKKLRKKLLGKDGTCEYLHYVNCDAIDVPFTECIPSDFAGLMGVPITFLDRYNPEQFEMLGRGRDMDLPTKTGMPAEFLNDYFAQGGTGSMRPGHPDLCYYDADGKAVVPYRRIMLRHKRRSTPIPDGSVSLAPTT